MGHPLGPDIRAGGGSSHPTSAVAGRGGRGAERRLPGRAPVLAWRVFPRTTIAGSIGGRKCPAARFRLFWRGRGYPRLTLRRRTSGPLVRPAGTSGPLVLRRAPPENRQPGAGRYSSAPCLPTPPLTDARVPSLDDLHGPLAHSGHPRLRRHLAQPVAEAGDEAQVLQHVLLRHVADEHLLALGVGQRAAEDVLDHVDAEGGVEHAPV